MANELTSGESFAQEEVLVNFGIPKCPECMEKTALYCAECGLHPDHCGCVDVDYSSDPESIYCGSCQEFFINIPEQFLEVVETVAKEKKTCTCKPEAKFFCGKCGVVRSYDKSPWKVLDEVKPYKSSTTYSYTSTATTYMKCRHYDEPINLGNGVLMHPSSSNSDRKGGGKTSPIPDFGLYADKCWSPIWRNEFIYWPDMSIPVNKEMAAEQIRSAYILAKSGKYVEIGCIGGHGRTGTMLACMMILASRDPINTPFSQITPLLPKDAIKKVHTDYCKEAIETDTQEWFIHWFSHHYFKTALPEQPKPKGNNYSTTTSSSTTSSTGSCTEISHHAMMMRGHTVCYAKGPKCSFWETDLKKFEKHGPSKGSEVLLDKFPLLNTNGTIVDEEYCAASEHFILSKAGYKDCPINGPGCRFWHQDIVQFEKNDLTAVSLINLSIDAARLAESTLFDVPKDMGENPYAYIKMGAVIGKKDGKDVLWDEDQLALWTTKEDING